MKTLPLIVVSAALAATTTYATLIPLSVFREVSISGSTNGSSFSTTINSTALGSFDHSLSDSLSLNGWNVVSESSQSSTIDETGFLIDILLFSNVFPDDFRIPGGGTAMASSVFELSFAVLEPQIYDLTGSLAIFGPPAFPLFNLSLLGSGGTIFSQPFFPLSLSGILLPDTYTVRLDTNQLAFTDPLGDDKFVDSHLDFRVTSVPETGSTILYLLGGFLVLATPRVAWVTKERMKPQKSPSTCIREDMGYGGDWG